MKRDKWIESLLKLRRYHANQIRLFHSDEAYILIELNRRHRSELSQLTNPVYQAIAIRSQLDGLRQLDRARKMRLTALKYRHSEEVYNLMRLKMTTIEA